MWEIYQSGKGYKTLTDAEFIEYCRDDLVASGIDTEDADVAFRVWAHLNAISGAAEFLPRKIDDT